MVKNWPRGPARKSGILWGTMVETRKDNDAAAVLKQKFRGLSRLCRLKPHEMAEKQLQFYNGFGILVQSEVLAMLINIVYGKSRVNMYLLYIYFAIARVKYE